MPHRTLSATEPTFTTGEAAAILTLAGGFGGGAVSKRAMDSLVDKRLLPAKVVRRRTGRRALTSLGVALAGAELALRRDLPVTSLRKRVYQKIAAGEAAPGRVAAADAVMIDIGGPVARVEAALDEYERLMAEIEVDPGVQHGEPVLRGTRVTVYTIAALVEAETPPAEILRHYPSLSARQVEAARVYAQAHPRRGRPALPGEGQVVLRISLDELGAP